MGWRGQTHTQPRGQQSRRQHPLHAAQRAGGLRKSEAAHR